MLPPPNYAPQPPPRNGFVKPLLIGCGVVLVIFLIAGGVATWFTVRAVYTALHGASDAATVARSAVSSAQQAVTAAGASPDPAHAAAAGVAVLKALVGGGKAHVETLSRDELKADLPASVATFARTSSEARRGAFSGISGTTASANYGSGAQTVSVSVTDAANMPGLTTLMDIAMSIETEDDEGFQKSTTVDDVKVHEKWETAGKHSELTGIVGGRFVVNVVSDGVDVGVAETAFKAVDLAKLEAVAAATRK